MKKRTGLILIGGALCVLVALAIQRELEKPLSPPPAHPGPDTTIDSAADLLRPFAELQHSLERRAKIDSIVARSNVPIAFWGKTMDQDEQPLPGVKIQYHFQVYRRVGDQFDIETKEGEVFSDAAGGFTITGGGNSLSIKSLEKANYRHSSHGALGYDFAGTSSGGKFHADATKPVPFVLSDLARVEPLIHYREKLVVQREGPPVSFALWPQRPDRTEKLEIALVQDLAASPTAGNAENWNAKVTLTGGGLIEIGAREHYYKAPDGNYVSSLAIPKVPPDGAPHTGFYLRTDDGRYGRLAVRLYQSEDLVRCFVEVWLNPKPGNRHLELVEGAIRSRRIR